MLWYTFINEITSTPTNSLSNLLLHSICETHHVCLNEFLKTQAGMSLYLHALPFCGTLISGFCLDTVLGIDLGINKIITNALPYK